LRTRLAHIERLKGAVGLEGFTLGKADFFALGKADFFALGKLIFALKS
jgi:hypothetical protein